MEKIYLTTNGKKWGVMEYCNGNYYCHCDCVTGLFGGYNKDAVAEHSLRWKTKRTALKHLKNEFDYISDIEKYIETYKI